ncbi:MAG: hypothetical protein HOV80_15410 [Polyangiaceae bacterium]|nr:hypothetical protein [Polyangiaceae bacterium]
MSYLTLDADRLVRDAVDAYLEDRLRPEASGDCVFSTRNNKYRVAEGVVIEASDTSLFEAELVGWLAEELGQPHIEPRWRPYARAIFVERKTRHVVVTSRTLTRTIVSGNVPPVPQRARKASVIPPSPPIPVLKSTPPPTDGSPTPFRVAEGVRQAAVAAQRDLVISENEKPTTRPPPMEDQTVAKDRASYEDLLEASRTPDWPEGTPAIPKSARVPRSNGEDQPTVVVRQPIESLDDEDIIEDES